MAPRQCIAHLGCCSWCSPCFIMQVLPALARGMASSSAAAEEQAGSSKAQYAAGLSGLFAGIFGATVVASSADEVGDGLHAAHYPWPHEGPLDAYDHGSIRRGHQVYQQVRMECTDMCAAWGTQPCSLLTRHHFTPSGAQSRTQSMAPMASSHSSTAGLAPTQKLTMASPAHECRCALHATAWTTCTGASLWVWHTLRRRPRSWLLRLRCVLSSSSRLLLQLDHCQIQHGST